MAFNLENNALFSSLQKLYSRLLLRAYDARTKAYHKEGQGAAGHDIGASLSGQLDKLAAAGATASAGTGAASKGGQPVPRQPRTVTPARTPVPPQKHAAGTEQELATRTLDGLAKALKTGHTGAVSQPAMSDKLKSSAWTHLHAAFRFARQGDAAAAKVHGDIASQALKEVAHYMSDADYAKLVAEVEAELAGMAEATGTAAPPT